MDVIYVIVVIKWDKVNGIFFIVSPKSQFVSQSVSSMSFGHFTQPINSQIIMFAVQEFQLHCEISFEFDAFKAILLCLHKIISTQHLNSLMKSLRGISMHVHSYRI